MLIVSPCLSRGEVLTIQSLGTDTKIKSVTLLGSNSPLKWEQKAEGLSIIYPAGVQGKFAVDLK